MEEERLKEIKDSIDFQEKIANAYNCGDVVIVLNEERELYNEVVRLREIINGIKKEIDWLLERQYDSERFAKENGFNTYLPAKVNLEHLKNKIKKLEENNLTLEQLTGIAND